MSYPSFTYGVAFVSEDKGEMKRLFSVLPSHGIERLDTARHYPGSEKLIADLGAASSFLITTKAPPFSSVIQSAKESFSDLGVEKVDIYLLHAPDAQRPVSETMEEVQTLYKQGRFNKFGVSNFTAAQTRELYEYAKSKGYVLPTVYQANYNLVGRKNETLLFPTLRELGFTIQAYSPSAGGFLLKTAEQLAEKATGSRWGDTSKTDGKLYHGMYNRPKIVAFGKEFGELAESSGVGRIGLAYRWIRYHSALREEDSIILGARSVKQLEGLMTEIEKGPLESEIVKRLDEMWKDAEDEVPVDNFEVYVTIA